MPSSGLDAHLFPEDYDIGNDFAQYLANQQQPGNTPVAASANPLVQVTEEQRGEQTPRERQPQQAAKAPNPDKPAQAQPRQEAPPDFFTQNLMNQPKSITPPSPEASMGQMRQAPPASPPRPSEPSPVAAQAPSPITPVAPQVPFTPMKPPSPREMIAPLGAGTMLGGAGGLLEGGLGSSDTASDDSLLPMLLKLLGQ